MLSTRYEKFILRDIKFIRILENQFQIPDMRVVYFILFFILTALHVRAQEYDAKVSLIGEKEDNYESLIADCQTMLLHVESNSMEKAYATWSKMLSEMERQAELSGLDLKGVKMWINCFWNEDGSINQLVYYPKPNSKNMNFDIVSAFLEDFSANYVLEATHNSCFSHYGSASFPVFSKVKAQNEK